MKGTIFDIKRFAVHDGPGIRTTVFLKGCPLRCLWCHNPESISSKIEFVTKTVRLNGQSFEEKEQVGRSVTVDGFMQEIMADKVFMEESGGGVTFSGGEPLMQYRFLLEVLKLCKENGIHTTVDTSGMAIPVQLLAVGGYTDLFLFDLKMMDESLHLETTGESNYVIKENLGLLLSRGNTVRIRIPVIPGYSFCQENIIETIRFLTALPGPVPGVDLLPYHNIAEHKYRRFGMENRFVNIPSLERDDLTNVKNQFEEAGFQTQIGG